MPDQPSLLYDHRYGYLIPTENVRAAIRAGQQLETTLEAWEPSTVPDHLPDNDESRGHGSVR